jgi:hypothetical protein
VPASTRARVKADSAAAKARLKEKGKKGGEAGDGMPSLKFPHKLYHGTRQRFEGLPTPSTAQQWGRAVYFATDPRMPREEFGGGGGRVLEYYGDFQKPLHVPSDDYRRIVRDLEAESSRQRQELNDRAFAGDEAAERELDRLVDFDASEPEGGAAIAEQARKLGYDAIISEHDEYGHEVAVLDTSRLLTPEQAKAPSAIPVRAEGDAGPRRVMSDTPGAVQGKPSKSRRGDCS